MHNICGIDFGTSNSAISIVDGDTIKLAEVEGDKPTIPTALFFDAVHNQTLFGRAAQDQYIENGEGRFMRSLKRILGTPLMTQKTAVNGGWMEFPDIIAKFLMHIKAKAEAQNDSVLNSVVMGRPVFFVDGDDAANKRAEGELKQIARSVGFKNIEFQFEPIAAAFSHEHQIAGEKLALVVDIGGGTSDFTVIRLSQDRKGAPDRLQDVLANTGVRIGGNDFDRDISVDYLMPHLGLGTTYGPKTLSVPRHSYFDIAEWSKVNFVYTDKILKDFEGMFRISHAPDRLSRFVKVLEFQLGHYLISKTEGAKIDLSTCDDAVMHLHEIENDLSISVTQREMADAIIERIKCLDVEISNCLNVADVKPVDIDLVIMTGGSTELPMIQDLVSQKLPHAEVVEQNRMSSVALGLGHDAMRRFA